MYDYNDECLVLHSNNQIKIVSIITKVKPTDLICSHRHNISKKPNQRIREASVINYIALQTHISDSCSASFSKMVFETHFEGYFDRFA